MTNDIARPPAPAPADPQTGGMTIRVYTVNRHGTVIRERGTVNVLPSTEPLPFSSGFPPCDCPRCRKTRTANMDRSTDTDPVSVAAVSGSTTSPPDITAMRQTTALLLGPNGGTGELPPIPADLDTLTATLHNHLEQLIPEVERQAGRLPEDSIPRHCALACVGEARRRLQAGPSPRYGGNAGNARRLARVLHALCGHYEAPSRHTP
ncbi:DUF6415 family natural product biosynthesis protein [Streptomyces sp. NPDC056161]|uniref:DUF6415 family natural product biosynthesis protein n=1 Tax=Streptomyces sp. NPDC056161 TaxID=3345732 RepID=UPI0035E0A71B